MFNPETDLLEPANPGDSEELLPSVASGQSLEDDLSSYPCGASVNPASGLPMMEGSCLDAGGNVFGTDDVTGMSNDSFSGFSDDGFSSFSSFDD